MGVRGIGWHRLRHAIEAEVLLGIPRSIIVVHLGSIDLVNYSVLQIRNIMDREFRYLRAAFPTCLLIWIDILPRRTWPGAANVKAVDNKRRRINRLGRKLVMAAAHGDVLSCDIQQEDGLFRPDGIHLNDVGLEFYLDSLRDTIIKHC
ncbi:hypothetical protein DPMN_129305 [Dreissena polymorpha]|uniref:SGNH hydrolase-type esterase domain-containing protein n=1 Tax=Dreissena polymorpha TaxID=45954 RepID=A0A9D4H5I5_DREPO|nr:hypothetical protein DPMN_129305 [Dreissena polymorpha]